MLKKAINNEFLNSCIHYLVYLVTFFFIILNITYSTSQMYQTDKDLFFYRAVIWVCLLCFWIVSGVRKYLYPVAIVVGLAVVFAVFKYKNISADTYGEVYSKVLFYKAVIEMLAVIFVIGIVVSKALTERVKKIGVLGWLYFVAAIAATVVARDNWIPLVVPAVMFLLADVDMDKSKKMFDSICISYYVCFASLFTKSLLFNSNHIDDRYIGDFLNIGAGGMFAGGAVVCAMFFLVRFGGKAGAKLINSVIAVMAFAYAMYAVLKFDSRGAELGVILAVMGFVIFYFAKTYKGVVVRTCICVGACIAIVGVAIGASVALNHKYGENVDWSKVSYWEVRILQLTNSEYQTDYFGDNALLNTIDTFSSGRLVIFVPAVRMIRPWPVEFRVQIDDWEATSPHNFFLSWMLDYGAIVGFLFNAWYVIYLVKGIRLWKEEKESALLPLLWHIYCFGAFMFLTNHWNMISPFLLLMLQGPMAMKVKKAEMINLK